MCIRDRGLLLAIAAGLAIRAENLSVGESAIVIAIYTVIGALTVAVPVILSLVDRKGTQPRLLSMKDWLSHNSATVTALILLLIGVVIIGAGMANL